MSRVNRIKICGVMVAPPPGQPISIYLDIKNGPLIAGPYYETSKLADHAIARDVATLPNLRDVLEGRGLIPIGECLVSIPVKVVVEHGEGEPEEYPGQRLDGVMLPKNSEHALTERLFKSLDQRDEMARAIMDTRTKEVTAGIKAIETIGKEATASVRALTESATAMYKPIIDHFTAQAEFQQQTAREYAKGTAESKAVSLIETLGTAWLLKQGGPLMVKALQDEGKPTEAPSNSEPKPLKQMILENSNDESEDGIEVQETQKDAEGKDKHRQER